MVEIFIENGISIVYEVTEEGQLFIYQIGKHQTTRKIEEKNKTSYFPCSISLCGETGHYLKGNRLFGMSGNTPWKFLSQKTEEMSDGKTLIFSLQRDSLILRQYYRFYNGISTVRCWSEVINNGTESVGLEYLSSFCQMGIAGAEEANSLYFWLPHNAWRRELDWHRYSLSDLGLEKISSNCTKRVSVSNTGSWSSKEYLPMGALENSATGETLLWQIESNGSWHWEFSDDADAFYLLLGGPNENENHWYRELKTGESFESVRVAIAFDKDWNGVIEAMTQYRRKIRKSFQGDAELPVIFNDYMNCLWANPSTEKELPLIHRAAKLGAEVYCMDAGWYADENNWWDTIGLWKPSSVRFPSGIQEVFREIRKCGMIPGIWLEIESMGVRCPLASKWEDECFVCRHGKRVVERDRYQLDFRSFKVRDYAMQTVDWLIAELGIGYFKIDYNIDIGMGTDQNADSPGDGLLQMNRAYLSWIDEVCEKYPKLILENCSSGGMRLDYAMLSHHALQSVSDQENVFYMAPIAAASATAVLPEQAAIWVYPKATDGQTFTEMNLVNALPLRIHLSGEMMAWTAEQTQTIQQGISLYKELRNQIASTIPFYPLGVPQYHSDWLCTGYKAQKNVLALWKMKEGGSVCIPLKNKPKRIVEIFPKNAGTVTVMPDGLLVDILKVPGSLIIVYET